MNPDTDTNPNQKVTIFDLYKKAPKKQKRRGLVTVILVVVFIVGSEVINFVGDIPRREYCKSVGGNYYGEFMTKHSSESGCYLTKDIWIEKGKEMEQWENVTSHLMRVFVGPEIWPCQVFPPIPNSSDCLAK